MEEFELIITNLRNGKIDIFITVSQILNSEVWSKFSLYLVQKRVTKVIKNSKIEFV